MDGQIKAELQRIHQRAKNEFDLAKITEAGVQKSVSDQEQQVSNLSDSIDKLLLLHQEESSNRLLYQDLYTKLEEANVSAGSRASNITVVDPARIAARPSSPKAVLNLAMGLGAGLFLGVFAAFSRDYLDDSVVTPAQVELLTNSPVLGLVPAFALANRGYGRYLPSAGKQQFPPEGQSPAWLVRAPRSPISEAYRQLRTSLLMARADQSLRTMLFTSPLPGDGKSTSCFNTAVACALQGGRVLVIDADMRRPNMHNLAECQNKAGLSQYLANNLQAEEVIQQHGEIKNLSILSAGLAPPMPAELLGSKRFVDALRQFRKEFDFVLIDAPPLLPITDSVVISHHVDGVILVIRSGVTTRSVLRRSLTTLAMADAPLVGLVMNAADTNSVDFGSTYGYYGDGDYYVKNFD
jgi:capsular exopolysaccharide synthesis family protein